MAKVKDFRPARKNANKHTARGLGALQTSIQSDGWIGAMTTAADGEMIAGSARIETAAQVFGVDAEPIVVESDGTRPIIVKRTDIPDAADKRAVRLALADNRIHQFDLNFDVEVLASYDADILDGLWTAEELSDLGQQWTDEQSQTQSATTTEQARQTLAERFLVPPFSVLDARQGYWQARKSAWLALGIQSELGRGDGVTCAPSDAMIDPTLNLYRKANATPGGAPRPAARLGPDGHTQRGDGKGRKLNSNVVNTIDGVGLKIDAYRRQSGERQPLDRAANGKGLSRTFGQDLMRGEHVVGENRLTWVAGARERDDLDDTSRKILAAGRKAQGFPHGPTVTQNADGTLRDSGASRDEWLTEADGNHASGTSIFDPVLCELAYTWFSAPGAQVLDPFAGGSVRGIVAAYLGRYYTGIDLRPEQVAANVEQAGRIVPDNPPTWLVGDSQDAIPERSFDFVFSCPPYYDLEIYSDDPADLSTMDYTTFLMAYRSIIAQAVARLANDRFACFCVGDVRDKAGIYRNFVSETVRAFQDAGAMLYNEAVLVTAVGSLPIRSGKQFSASRKLGKTHQNVLVFVKGDARKAADWCGPVKIGDLQGADKVGA